MDYKQWVWRIVPEMAHKTIRHVYFVARLLPNAWYDFRRFLVYSGLNKSMGYRGEQEARITMAYHQLEKGLSLASPRPGFGKEAANRLLAGLGPFIAAYGYVQPATTGLKVLGKYLDFNKEDRDIELLRYKVDSLLKGIGCAAQEFAEGGTITLKRAELEASRRAGYASFFESRYSIRAFSGELVPDAVLRDVVRIAQKTPSVCNRQAWRVHAYSSRRDIEPLLALQNGSRGFSDGISLLLVVTCDLSRFVEVGERYQAWIDGGMFSMALCLGFHDRGFGTCCLNWSKEKREDLELRKLACLPIEDQVIMMIGVGTLQEEFRVAASARRPLLDVLICH